jgi:hypothetical protein
MAREVAMDMKGEGVVFPPVPLVRVPGGPPPPGASVANTSGPLCEMCGAPAIASHCKRICLRCGFMTGCSEGV